MFAARAAEARAAIIGRKLAVAERGEGLFCGTWRRQSRVCPVAPKTLAF
jgi:hypothetical protein